ncbi:protein FlbA [Kordiimonas sediminis]|uniref:Protein FlbA n=2 Tax=Kordiimonas sediminis TaxID=1735581 RepID=A0A919AWT9_9PROT|nr:protein FlbA [Kordiimonas sediminis]
MGSVDFSDDKFMDKHLRSGERMPAKVRKMVREAKKHQQEGNWAEVVKAMNAAWKYAPDNLEVLMVLAYALGKLGVRDKALSVIEHLLSIHEPNSTICQIMGSLAIEMGMYDIGAKLWRVVLQFEPTLVSAYVNLITCMKEIGQLDEAVALAQQVLPQFPQEAILWNALATVVKERDGEEASIVFYEEALKLEPDNAMFLSNIANVLEDPEQCIKVLRRALEVDPEFTEPKIALAYRLLQKGDLEEGFNLYEARHNSRRKQGQNVIYANKFPRWEGENLEGKTLLIMNEQGLGDEILFASVYKEIIARAKKVILTCDIRLKTLLERSFPETDVYPAHDGTAHGYTYRTYKELQSKINRGEEHVDYAVPLASLPKYLWKTSADVKGMPVPMFKPDPMLKQMWEKRVSSVGEGLKVGISWASGLTQGRSKGAYLTLQQMAPILSVSGVKFFNLQYSNYDEDIRLAQEQLGVTIHHWDDFNVKHDLEGNIALMSSLDLVLGPTSSPQLMAAAAGVPVWWMTPGTVWWLFGSKSDAPSIYSKGHLFDKQSPYGPWDDTVEEVSKALVDFRDKKLAND